MSKKSIAIQPAKFRSLKRSKRSDYDLYKAALEWGLTEPIVIDTRQDLRSESQWTESIEPYQHQVSNLITFCRRLPVTLLADDVGLGKTISAGLIASELMSRGRLSKILIVCPKLIMPQWKEELQSKFNIASEIAIGKELLSATPPDGRGAVITTYASARLYLDVMTDSGFELLILDEAHKLRNLHGVGQAPQVAQKFRAVLSNRVFKYVLMLTATPIQNRLWDIYSLIDLLTVARGHENPFGSTGMFTRRFIADNKSDARVLRPDKKDEFRSIVYSHMSRTRRGDAKLYFPERKVQLHRVKPTSTELELIKLISQPIQKMNRLAQISIAQALISSPHALAAQLETMARNKTVPQSLATEVRAIAENGKITAKQAGLEALADQLKAENPQGWRMVVFTTRRETQTTIEAFLSARGIACGIINGDSGSKNQSTVTEFRKDPPEINVIISTEAGSEGVNLQAANVIVNYDLPWNPMIVEQRIGRVQRLASKHATVCVFNVILSGTFEEYIVGRLMEKLQMASHAIGDVDALLEAAGIDEEETGFEEKLRELVIASIAGMDVKESVRLTEQSIADAKTILERDKKDLDDLLGGKPSDNNQPQCPRLPPPSRSLGFQEFAMRAIETLGGRIHQIDAGTYSYELEGKSELTRFDEKSDLQERKVTRLTPGQPAFERLVSKVSGQGRHLVSDLDLDIYSQTETQVRDWIGTFNGEYKRFSFENISPCFVGTALLRTRVTVAHDSFEKLVEIECSQNGDSLKIPVEPLAEFIFDPKSIGIPIDDLVNRTMQDDSVADFCRFYSERLEVELKAAGSDPRARQKIEDDFTPRLHVELVGLEGQLYRQAKVAAYFTIDSHQEYKSTLTVIPSKMDIRDTDEFITCDITARIAPASCFGVCDLSKKKVLRHLLKKSESSGRSVLSEYITVCAVSGKNIARDEIKKSDVSGRMLDQALLKKSEMSGRMAEFEYFTKCEFTTADLLLEETAVSEISKKRYRTDQEMRSVVSRKVGHKSEFVFCAETNQPLSSTEAESCELTGKLVKPGLLQTCESTGQKVISSELVRCAATGKKVVKKVCVKSNLSDAWMLESTAIRSEAGTYCMPAEAKICFWSARRHHPEDSRVCGLLGLTVHKEDYSSQSGCFVNMSSLLAGHRSRSDKRELWVDLANLGERLFAGANCEVENAEMSPSNTHLAVCMKVSKWFGLRVRYIGFVYSISDSSVVGKIASGKRENGVWLSDGQRDPKAKAA